MFGISPTATIQDRDLRQEFYRIQEAFARIIIHDACTVGGIFYYSSNPLDIRLFTMKDGVRPFLAPKTAA